MNRRVNLQWVLVWGTAFTVVLLLINWGSFLTYPLWQLIGIQLAIFSLAIWVDINTVKLLKAEKRKGWAVILGHRLFE